MMSRPLAHGLIKRNIEVVMAIDVGMMGKRDPEHLAFVAERGLTLVTLDRAFAGIAANSLITPG